VPSRHAVPGSLPERERGWVAGQELLMVIW
jgi:hypothetical protein